MISPHLDQSLALKDLSLETNGAYAVRWLEAFREGCAPRVSLTSTHKAALTIIPLDALKQCALDLN